MKRKSLEAEYGVRLVKPHSVGCQLRERPMAVRRDGGTFYTRGETVRRDRGGRDREGSWARWLKFTCILSDKCEAEALMRLDVIETLMENTLNEIQKKKGKRP